MKENKEESKKESKLSLWLRAGMMILVVLGTAFVLYGRLVKVETRLTTLEKGVAEIHGRLFGTGMANK